MVSDEISTKRKLRNGGWRRWSGKRSEMRTKMGRKKLIGGRIMIETGRKGSKEEIMYWNDCRAKNGIKKGDRSNLMDISRMTEDVSKIRYI